MVGIYLHIEVGTILPTLHFVDSHCSHQNPESSLPQNSSDYHEQQYTSDTTFKVPSILSRTLRKRAWERAADDTLNTVELDALDQLEPSGRKIEKTKSRLLRNLRDTLKDDRYKWKEKAYTSWNIEDDDTEATAYTFSFAVTCTVQQVNDKPTTSIDVHGWGSRTTKQGTFPLNRLLIGSFKGELKV
jgi:hypothetical protein